MRVLVLVLALLPTSLWASAGSAADFASRIRLAGLDPDQCYRVREINFSRDDVRIYLTDGYLIFGNPIDGRRFSAVFSAESQSGDAELLVLPPQRSERLSLAKFTKSPNLNEHFGSAVMLFTDNTAEELLRLVEEQVNHQPSPEMGTILARKWRDTVGNLAVSFSNRMIFDLITRRPLSDGFFYAAVTGETLGNFDLIYDPIAAEQILIGQVDSRDGRAVFDVWTQFKSRPFRNGQREQHDAFTPLGDHRIEATLDKDLRLSVVTRATMSVEGADQRLLYFEIAPRMEISQVFLDGQSCEVWRPSSMRDDLLHRRANGVFLVFPPEPVQVGRTYEMEFHHAGNVVDEAGNDVYYVGSRSTWYPRQGMKFSDYDITFRFPESLDLVFTGEVLEDRTEGDWHITRRRTETPIRYAGFNLGRYEQVRLERPGFAVEVFANRNVEQALEPEQKLVPVRPGAISDRRTLPGGFVLIPSHERPAAPTARLESLANEIADAFAYMIERFGPPPTRTLTVSPIPGSFGQGFPGLLYISTMSYLTPEKRPQESRDMMSEFFYSEILHAHETAHQWWGNVVSNESYQDEWLMEGLANYSALMLLEQNEGPQALATVLNHYRSNLLTKGGDGETLESSGPICWGQRLLTSDSRAWQTVTYDKGSWIFHMLRRRMGDEQFLSMLGELSRRYRFRSVSTEQFRLLASEFLPANSPDPQLENFFDQWAYGVGIPDLRFSNTVRGSAPNVRVFGNVQQSGVTSEFGVDVPIEIQMADGVSTTLWRRTGPDPVPFDVTLSERPRRVIFNPGHGTLTTRN